MPPPVYLFRFFCAELNAAAADSQPRSPVFMFKTPSWEAEIPFTQSSREEWLESEWCPTLQMSASSDKGETECKGVEKISGKNWERSHLCLNLEKEEKNLLSLKPL